MFRDFEATLVSVWAEKRRVRNVFAFFDSIATNCIRYQMFNNCFWIEIVSMSGSDRPELCILEAFEAFLFLT